jgi:hypothetical protein
MATSLNVTGTSTHGGVSTFAGGLVVSSGVTTTGALTATSLNVTGTSTHGGIATFVGGLVSTVGVTTTGALTASSINVAGVSTLGTTTATMNLTASAVSGGFGVKGADGVNLNCNLYGPNYQLMDNGLTRGKLVFPYEGYIQSFGSVGTNIGPGTAYWLFGSNATLYGQGPYFTGSDIKLKENITHLDGPSALAKVCMLTGCEFTMKADVTNTATLGFIAQEVEAIFPQVIDDKNGTKYMSYIGLISPMVEAIKQLKVQVDEIKLRCL